MTTIDGIEIESEVFGITDADTAREVVRAYHAWLDDPANGYALVERGWSSHEEPTEADGTSLDVLAGQFSQRFTANLGTQENQPNQEVQHGAPSEISDRGETASGATPGQSHVQVEPSAPVPAPREVGRSGGASGVEAGASCEFALTDRVLRLLARGDEDFALPLHLTNGVETLTDTVIVHDANDAAVLDTMTKGRRPCDFDRFIVAAINAAPALARELVRIRDERDNYRGVYHATVAAHRETKVELGEVRATLTALEDAADAKVAPTCPKCAGTRLRLIGMHSVACECTFTREPRTSEAQLDEKSFRAGEVFALKQAVAHLKGTWEVAANIIEALIAEKES